MDFDLSRWRTQVREWWAEQGPRLGVASIQTSYPLLVASAWLPLLAAYAREPGQAVTALVGITASVGSNLVANLVQGAYDRARGGQQAAGQARHDASVRAELDAVLQATRALEAAQEALGEEWDGFSRQLAQELAHLPGGSTLIVQLGDGAVVEGSVVAGDLTLSGGSTYVGRDQTIIEHADQVVLDAPRPPSAAHTTERALRRYLERVATECNALYLRGMDPRAADATRQETMSLAAVYTALDTDRQVFVEGDELEALKQRRRGILPGLTRGEAGERAQRPLSALEVASRIDRLVLLGEPGAGKSTFVNHLAYRLAQAALGGQEPEALPGWARGRLLPLRVVLRDLAHSPDMKARGSAAAFWSFVGTALQEADLAEAAPALAERLDGRVLLLLDGLDEVDPETRRPVLEAVADFARSHGRTPMLVTCRVYAYQEPAWRLARFEAATLLPFDQDKIDRFIAVWYTEVSRLGLLSASEAGERAARLRTAVRRLDLRSLAPNPLLLTMMALLHSSWGRLPEDRVQLYGEIVELLLARWEQSRLGREVLAEARLSPRDLRFALEEAAYRGHGRGPAEGGTADVSEALLRQVLQTYLEGDWGRAGDAVRYVRERAGLLLERRPGVYAFPHRTLQEYLAGCYLSVQPDFPARASELLRHDEVRWREPFLLAVGKTARSENRVELALAAVDELCPRERPELPDEGDSATWRCAWLAGEALLEVGTDTLRRRDPWTAKMERVAGWLARLLEAGALEPVERAAAGRVLGRLGDPRDLEARVHVPAGPFRMGSGKREKDADEDEQPRHTVEVGEFCIGKFPVTNGQYARFVEAEGYQERHCWTELGWAWRAGVYDSRVPDQWKPWIEARPVEKRDRPFWWDDPELNLRNHPVVGVCWFEAVAYTRWLSQVTGRPCRLPTEAEWEKAARGTDGRRYPWGADWAADCANSEESGIRRSAAVGSFPAGASPCGAMDLAGNVWEWCSSAYAGYPYRTDDGREDWGVDGNRVLRGGAWYSDQRLARCGSRFVYFPDDHFYSVGFRVVFPGSAS